MCVRGESLQEFLAELLRGQGDDDSNAATGAFLPDALLRICGWRDEHTRRFPHISPRAIPLHPPTLWFPKGRQHHDIRAAFPWSGPLCHPKFTGDGGCFLKRPVLCTLQSGSIRSSPQHLPSPAVRRGGGM